MHIQKLQLQSAAKV